MWLVCGFPLSLGGQMAFCMREIDEQDLNAESRKHNSCSKPKGCLAVIDVRSWEWVQSHQDAMAHSHQNENRQTCHVARRTRQDIISSVEEIWQKKPAEQDLCTWKKECCDMSHNIESCQYKVKGVLSEIKDAVNYIIACLCL